MPKSLMRELFSTILLSVLILFSIPPAKAATPMISVGEFNTCTLSEMGTVQCWGGVVPKMVPNIDNAVSISNYYEHSCAVLHNGQVKCWGSNESAQLGVDSEYWFDSWFSGSSFSSPPLTISGITDAISVGVSKEASCAALSTGKVKCWGMLFDGANYGITPTEIPGINNAVSITGGMYHMCVLLRTGEIRCWGQNTYGDLGNGNNTNSTTPVAAQGIQNAIAISTGRMYKETSQTCAVLQTGQVKCWGLYPLAQNRITNNTPTTVNGISDAIDIAVGNSHTCVILRNKTVQCWGDNDWGTLGNMSWENSEKTPVTVLGINDVLSISARDGLTCALLKTGEVRCWGKNEFGQRGNTTIQKTPYSAIPVTVKGITNAKSIALGPLGDNKKCATLSTGELQCWGDDQHGSLQYGSTPVTINGITNPISVAIGTTSICAALQSGEVKCWGNNFNGQLGDGTQVESKIPVTVKGINDAISVTVIVFDGVCATLRSGGVRCWGAEQDINKLLNYIPPLYPLKNTSNCKVFDGGKVQCWGENSYGQLGNGKTNGVSSDAPVTVVGITDAVAVSGGQECNCAVLSTGSIQCWGYDPNGALGAAGALSYLAPSTVMGVGGIGYLNLFAFSQNVDKVFTWAENRLPQFKPSGVSQSMLGYRYRGYQDRYYLAVNEGGTPHVYYFDNTSMDSLMDVGLLSDFLNLVGN